MIYKNNPNFCINVGFVVNSNDILHAVEQANSILSDLPSNLFKSIDYKTTSAMIGAIFCNTLANLVGAIVNTSFLPMPSTHQKKRSGITPKDLKLSAL
jgi:hypothetical protein